MVWPALHRRLNPFAELDPFFGPWQGVRGLSRMPTVNLYTNEEGAVLKAEVPGIDPDSLDVSVQNDTVTLRGKREPESGENEEFIRQERQYGEFVRTLTLPHKVEQDNVNAKFKDGILEIHLPRAEEAKPKKIEVQQSE